MKDLINQLTYTAEHMLETAQVMQEHDDLEIKEHGAELEGAALTMETWIEGMEE